MITRLGGEYRIQMPKSSGWRCHLFNSGTGTGIVWEPDEGGVPNIVVRFFMRICLGCRWEKPRTEKPKPSCDMCGGPIGQDKGPKDGWQLEDGRCATVVVLLPCNYTSIPGLRWEG